jgi:hypothetical protein
MTQIVDVRVALRTLVAAVLALMPMPMSAQTAAIQIELAHNTPKEQSESARLQGLLARFDLTPWLFTRRILIDEKAIPHSHPVLTVGYGDHDDDNLLLSNFVHEQLHWWLVAHQPATDAAVAELRQIFPGLPIGGTDGAQDEQSSYLHLIVNYLEYQGDKVLLGDQKAADVMAFWKDDHYRVIYKTMLESEDVVGRVVAKHGLNCCSSL